MDLVQRGAVNARRVAIFPAAWNPPTQAHMALANAALGFADEVLLALPRVFPHKQFDYTSFDIRLEWLRRIAGGRARLGVAVTDGGLFLEIARALRNAEPEIEQIYVVCGSDAAARFLAWPYTCEPSASEQLQEFSLLVAPREELSVPKDFSNGAIHELRLRPELRKISSTDIRRRIQDGEAWTHLVPPEVVSEAGRIYR